MAAAAKDAGVKHVIWSTLEDTRKWVPLSRRPHADADGASTRCRTSTRRARRTTSSRDAGVPTTFLLTSFYWDNFIHFGMGPKKGPDGKLAITLPMGDKKLPGIAAEDIGRCAYGIFKQRRRIRRQDRRHRRRAPHRRADGGGARARRWARRSCYNAVPPEVFRGFGFPGADDLGNMFQFKRDFEDDFCGARDLAVARSLNPAAADLRRLARAEQGPHPAGIGR